jgi:hypothetical protein
MLVMDGWKNGGSCWNSHAEIYIGRRMAEVGAVTLRTSLR